MNLNLVKQPQHISLQYRSSSLPTQQYQQNLNAHTPPSKLPSQLPSQRSYHHNGTTTNNHQFLSFAQYENKNDKSRKSIEKKNDDSNDSEDDDDTDPLGMGKVTTLDTTKSMDFVKPKRKKSSKHRSNKLIHVVQRAKSQNNTPPRPIASMLKKKHHHKKSRLSSFVLYKIQYMLKYVI